MGSFYLADAVTGLNLTSDMPVVGIVIQRRLGGYPDAQAALTKAPIEPTDIFEPASLPIFGKANFEGGMTPNPRQYAVDLFCEMAGEKDWEKAFGKASDFSEGGLSFPLPRMARVLGKSEPDKEILGLMVVHKSTWDAVCAARYGKNTMKKDIETMKKVEADFQSRAKGPDKDDRLWFDGISYMGLKYSTHRFVDGSELRMPPVAAMFHHLEGGSKVSSHLTEWMSDHGPLKRIDDLTLPTDLLKGLWELDAFQDGMRSLSKVLAPSVAAGQHSNAARLLESTFSTIETGADHLMLEAEENGYDQDDESVKRIAALLDKMEALRERLAERLTKIGKEDSFAP